jgi:hypothetical protein
MTYHDRFPSRAVFPVIHIFSTAQVLESLAIAAEQGADGVFLIDHNGMRPDALKQILSFIHKEGWFERLWIGANFLGIPNIDAFAISYDLQLHGIWSDNAQLLRSDAVIDPDAYRKGFNDSAGAWDRTVPLYFGGVAFKGQPQHEDDTTEAAAAVSYVDVVTTSGPETGRAASIEKLRRIRQAIGDHPLAVASGVTPENVADQLAYVDAVLVATGINLKGNFYRLDPDKLKRLVDITHSYQPPN